MVQEIVLAIDPALCKIEKILLWKNKLKTCGVFTLSHVIIWLMYTYNIRTYCTLAIICLGFHLLDAYRTKKRREILKLQANKNVVEGLSSLGRFIIYFNNKLKLALVKLNKLKRRNRLIYFFVMLTFWSMTAIIGTKIQGFYLSYSLFWIIFFVPAIIHFDIPRKLLRRILPLLEQLDHSMKYERRSILEKKDLLVDVKHKNNDSENEAEEDKYLESFQLDDLEKIKANHRRAFENLEDESTDEDEEEIENGEEESEEELEDNDEDDDDEEEEEIIEEVFEIHNYAQNYANDKNQIQVSKLISKKSNKSKAPIKPSEISLDIYDSNNDSLITDEFLPNINMSALADNYSLTSSVDESFFNTNFNKVKNIDSGNKVFKNKNNKVRPSLLDYYGDSSTNQTAAQKKPQNENDIDETFDFLDDELNKYM